VPRTRSPRQNDEHDHTLFARWRFLERPERDVYRLPEGVPSLPLMYSLLARPSSTT
jgi:hypothetical protein